MKLKIGDRVRLIVSFYGGNSNNPVWGGRYGKIVGTVRNVSCNPLPICVNWDNCKTNYYNEQDLSHVQLQLNLFSKEEK